MSLFGCEETRFQTRNRMMFIIPNLERFYYSQPGTLDNKFERYLLNTDKNIPLRVRIEKYGAPISFKEAWYKIYKNNEEYIEKFIRGDESMIDIIDWNNLCHIFNLGWPGVGLYNKEPGNYGNRDYLNIANRLWMINKIT